MRTPPLKANCKKKSRLEFIFRSHKFAWWLSRDNTSHWLCVHRCKRKEYKCAAVRKLSLSQRAGVTQQYNDPNHPGPEQNLRLLYSLTKCLLSQFGNFGSAKSGPSFLLMCGRQQQDVSHVFDGLAIARGTSEHLNRVKTVQSRTNLSRLKSVSPPQTNVGGT